MHTQEVWFPDYAPPPDVLDHEHPSHGCITDGVDGHEVAVVVYAGQAGAETSQVVTPDTHPRLHTILDPGQPVPPLLEAAKGLGFEVTYHLHGTPSPWTMAAQTASPSSARRPRASTKEGADDTK